MTAIFWKASAADDRLTALEAALGVLTELRQWGDRLPALLAKASQDGLEPGWVWQADVRLYFGQYDKLELALGDVNDRLVNLGGAPLPEPRGKSSLSFPLGEFEFFPNGHRDEIAYSVPALKVWSQAFGKWAADTGRNVMAEIRKLRQA